MPLGVRVHDNRRPRPACVPCNCKCPNAARQALVGHTGWCELEQSDTVAAARQNFRVPELKVTPKVGT